MPHSPQTLPLTLAAHPLSLWPQVLLLPLPVSLSASPPSPHCHCCSWPTTCTLPVLELSGDDGETAILCQLQGVVRCELSVLVVPGEGGLWIPPHHHFEEHTFSLNSSRVSRKLLNQWLWVICYNVDLLWLLCTVTHYPQDILPLNIQSWNDQLYNYFTCLLFLQNVLKQRIHATSLYFLTSCTVTSPSI